MSESAKPVPSTFQRLREVTAKILAVPKAEIDRREAEWRKAKDAKDARRRK